MGEQIARRVAIAGNPNTGKSTIFNALTGLRQKVGNYPGVTVEKKTGKFFGSHGEQMELIDLPGSYWFDDRLNRSIGVHPAYIRAALEKVYGATALLAEINRR